MKLIARTMAAAGLLIPALLTAEPYDPDPSFGTNGTLPLPLFIPGPDHETDYQLEQVAQMADERIAMVGHKTVGPTGNRQTRPVIAVVGEFGESVNQGFILNSEWNPDFVPSGEHGWLNALQTLPNGELLYCGGHTSPGGIGNGDRAVVGRLRADLTPDTGFGEAGAQGWQRIALGLGDIDCHAIEQLAGGRILIGGSYVDQNLGQNEFNKGAFLAMLTSDGHLDPAFGNGGILTRFRSLGTLPTTQFAFTGLHQGHSTEPQPELRSLIAIERELGMGNALAHGLTVQGALPGFWAVQDIAVDFRRRLHSARLPSGALQIYSDDGLNSLLRRHNGGGLGYDNGVAWSLIHANPAHRQMAGGMSLDLDGQSLLAVRNYSDHDDWENLSLIRVSHSGQVVFDQVVGTGLPIPPGSTEIIDVADVLIQTNRRYLVLFNRAVNGPGGGPQRSFLRRFMGGSSAGTSWFDDLQPDGLFFDSVAAPPGQLAVSQPLTISGLSAELSVPAHVSGGEMSVNEGPWTSAPVMLQNGHRVRLRGIAPLDQNENHIVGLRAGGIRMTNSWNPLAATLTVSDFVIEASQPVLPGALCSDGPLNTHCSGSIPDGIGNLESTINLIGSCPFIESVRVGVDISHPRVGDLRLILKDPNGQIFIGGSEGFVSLMDQPASSDGGACPIADVLAGFDDQALTSVDQGCGLIPGAAGIAGILRPSQALGSLAGRFGTGNDGADGNGLWTLIVRDMVAGQSGVLNDWSLDVSCASSMPNLSDLAVAAVGGSQAIAGETFTMSFIVTNLGPATASFGRFFAQTPTELWNPTWDCTTTAGSSCSLPPTCIGGMGCPGPVVDPGLNLLSGGTATITIGGTINPSAVANTSFLIDGLAYIPLNIAGNSDPNGANNQYLLARSIEQLADLESTLLSATVIGMDRIKVEASYRNNGPSMADAFNTTLALPAGYGIATWSCTRGNVSCGLGEISPDQRSLTIGAQGSWAGGDPFLLTLEATFASPQMPGQVTLHVQHAPGSGASDPQTGNNTRVADIPVGPLEDRVFTDRFQ